MHYYESLNITAMFTIHLKYIYFFAFSKSHTHLAIICEVATETQPSGKQTVREKMDDGKKKKSYCVILLHKHI